MVRRAAILVTGVLLSGVVLPVTVVGGACASEADRAALVIDTGDDVLRYCVTLPAESVSGLDVIELAGDQYGLSYKFGFGGKAVCMLAGVGPTGDDCFEEYPDFWGYWRGNGAGGWNWSSSGAADTAVQDGDVEGWSWGSGNDAGSHPAPPSATHESVCPPPQKAKEDRPEPVEQSDAEAVAQSSSESRAEPGPAGAPRSAGERTAAPRHKVEPRERVKRRDAASAPAPEAAPSPVAAEPGSSGESPPPVGLIGLTLAGLMGAGAFVAARARAGPARARGSR